MQLYRAATAPVPSRPPRACVASGAQLTGGGSAVGPTPLRSADDHRTPRRPDGRRTGRTAAVSVRVIEKDREGQLRAVCAGRQLATWLLQAPTATHDHSAARRLTTGKNFIAPGVACPGKQSSFLNGCDLADEATELSSGRSIVFD